MTGKDQELAAWAVLAFCLVFGIVGGLSCMAPVRADTRLSTTESTQLILAKAAVAECGWRLPDCHAAVWHSLENRIEQMGRSGTLAPGYGLRELATNYCTALKGTPRTDRHWWVQDLPEPEPAALAPAHWPEGSLWDKHLPRWSDIYERAGAFLRGSVADPCRRPSCHFGGDMDQQGPRNQGWEKTECGKTCTGDRCQNFYEC